MGFSRFFAWVMLFFAILLEICGLSLLKVFDNADLGTIGKVVLVVFMGLSYFLMSLTLREIAVGVAYATWEIVGGIGVLLISFVFFEPHLSTEQYFGIAFGFAGIVCIILGEEHKDSKNCKEAKIAGRFSTHLAESNADSTQKKADSSNVAESPSCSNASQRA